MSRKIAVKRGRQKAPKKLTLLEEKFAHEWLVDGCAGRAIVRAGSKAAHPDQAGYEIKNRPHVAERIAHLMAAQTEKIHVDKVWVQTELVGLYRIALAQAKTSTSSIPALRAALDTLKQIGQLVDVNAFRTQVGIGNPDGSNFEFSGLSDAEIDNLEALLSKAALTGGGESGEGPTAH